MTPAYPKKDLVMGVISKYDYAVVRPFIVSLRRTGFSGDIVLFHQRVGRETLGKLEQDGVILISFRSLSGLFPAGVRYDRLTSAVARPYHALKWPLYDRLSRFVLHPAKARYHLYLQYLRQHGARYDRVLLSDTRDVIFQADPFIDPLDEDILFFEESFPINVGECNAPWLRRHLGQAVLDRLAAKTTICSGTTIGTPNAVRWYLSSYVRLMRRARRQEFTNGDQALHNALVYEGLEDMPFTMGLCRNGEGPVLTMTRRLDTTCIPQAENGALLDSRDRVVPIIHQYDRHPEIRDRLLAALAY